MKTETKAEILEILGLFLIIAPMTIALLIGWRTGEHVSGWLMYGLLLCVAAGASLWFGWAQRLRWRAKREMEKAVDDTLRHGMGAVMVGPDGVKHVPRKDFYRDPGVPKAPVIEPRLVCAANKYADGSILIGVRHWDTFMHDQAVAYGLGDRAKPEQGFIDQRGNFYTRVEAYRLAETNGQRIASCGGDNGELYSENLY